MSSSTGLVAGTIFDAVAALMNNTSKSVYSNVVQLPYLNIAIQDLQLEFEDAEVPVTDNVTTDPIDVPAGNTEVGFTGLAGQVLPSDLIEPQTIWQRLDDTPPWYPMNRVIQLDYGLEDDNATTNWLDYVWETQKIKILASNQDNQLKIQYIRNLFSPMVDANSQIPIINAQQYLTFQTAAYCAHFIGEDLTRAQSLFAFASNSMNQTLGIDSKSRQNIMVRRRPFRDSYKKRNVNW